MATKDLIKLNQDLKNAIEMAKIRKMTAKPFDGLVGQEIRTIKGVPGEQGIQGEKGDKGDMGEKGDKGDKGDKGERGEIGPRGNDGLDGKDGRDGNGINGVDGKDGKDGVNGIDGTIMTPEQVRDKLARLEGDARLDATAIKNLPNPSYKGGGGGGVAEIVAGNNITTLRHGNRVTINAIGDGTGDIVGPAGATANAIPLFDGATGKLLKDSAKTIVTVLGADDTTVPTSKAVVDAISAEDIWDRVGTNISPNTAGDALTMGAGNITTTGNITCGDVFCYDPGATDYITAYHDGTDGIIGTNAGGVTLVPTTDVTVVLPDAGGAREFKILDSGTATVATIDSDGNANFTAGNITNTGYLSTKNFTISNHYTGFPDTTSTALSWNDGTYTLTLTATADDVWIDGVAYNINTLTKALTVAQEAASDLYWFWITAPLGVPQLNCDATAPGFDKCLTATVYWNTTTNKGVLSDERHWMGRDKWMHEYLHETVGARYASGMSGTFTDTTITIGAGEFYDEDLEHKWAGDQTTVKVLYHNGDADWAWDILTTPYKVVNPGVDDSLRYNNGNNLATVALNRYVNQWVFATGDETHPIHVVIGTAEYTTIASARAASVPSLGELLSAETKLIFKVTYRNVGGSPDYIETTDYRISSSLPSTGYVATDHGSLAGLGDNDHAQYALIRSVTSAAIHTAAGSNAQTDYVYFMSGTSNLTLPTAVSNKNKYTIKNTGVGIITVLPTGVETIDGETSQPINTQYDSISVLSDNTNWFII